MADPCKEDCVLDAGIIGLNWGRVHIGALRAAGVTVAAVCGRDPDVAARVARDEGIPLATTTPDDLAGLDVIVIATPAPSHGDLLRRFPSNRIICEKPLFGLSGGGVQRPASSPQVFVNYAFGFLDTARAAVEQLPRIGPLKHARLESRVALPGDFSVAGWFLETASHPLSWLLHCFGPAAAVSLQSSGSALAIKLLDRHGANLDIAFQVGGPPGIHHRVSLHGAGGTLAFTGGYVPGDAWRFSPVLLDNAPVSNGEWLPDDCWIRANHRSVAAMIDVFHGTLSQEEGLDLGLFDMPKATTVEAVLGSGGSDG